MKHFATLAVIGLVASGFAVSASLPLEGSPEIGKPAPEIKGKEWLNNLGTDPSLSSLRGQAVLLEFWATW